MSYQCLGEIRLFTGNFAIKGWTVCAGQTLSISANQDLFELVGTQFGGNGEFSFALPTLAPLAAAKGGVVNYIMCTEGSWPRYSMEGFMGEIRIFPNSPGGPPVPKNWTLCNGVPVAATPPLSGILGNTFGGNSQTVGIPNIAPPGPGLSYILCTQGAFPAHSQPNDSGPPGEAIIGEVRGFAGNFTPTGFLTLTEQIQLPIQGNEALFSIVRDAYGETPYTFLLPQLPPLNGGPAPVSYICDRLGFYPQLP